MISARRDLDDRVARRQDRQAAMARPSAGTSGGRTPGTGPRPGPVRRNLCKALAPGAGRNAGGLGRSSPSSLSVWPRSWRTVRNARCRRGGRTASAALASCTPRGILFPLAFTPHLAAGFAHRAAFNGLWLSATRAQASLPPCPVAPLAPVTSRSCGTVRHLCRRKVCRLPWPSRTLRARPGAASRRNTGTSCDPPRAGPLRILDTCRGRGVRR